MFSPPKVIVQPPVEGDKQAFVKFFGNNNCRSSLDNAIFEEVKTEGCHWSCNYPKNKHPRNVEDGAVMFMGRLVDPIDIIIFGKATGWRHVDGRDEASEKEIERRPFKKKWSNYIRVHDPEFVAGKLRNGVSLNRMMDELQSDSFISTQENARKGTGNVKPRRAYMRAPSVALTNEAFAWLNDRLEQSFTRWGKLTPAELATLDWPDDAYRGR
jgi:hypothetical protein